MAYNTIDSSAYASESGIVAVKGNPNNIIVHCMF